MHVVVTFKVVQKLFSDSVRCVLEAFSDPLAASNQLDSFLRVHNRRALVDKNLGIWVKPEHKRVGQQACLADCVVMSCVAEIKAAIKVPSVFPVYFSKLVELKQFWLFLQVLQHQISIACFVSWLKNIVVFRVKWKLMHLSDLVERQE